MSDKPSLDEYLRTLKSSTRDISWTAWKTDKGSPVSPGWCPCTQACDCNGCCAWLALSLLITAIVSWFGTIWLAPVPKHEKNTWVGSSNGPMWGHICSWGLIWGSGWYHVNPSTATPKEEVCGLQRRLWLFSHESKTAQFELSMTLVLKMLLLQVTSAGKVQWWCYLVGRSEVL